MSNSPARLAGAVGSGRPMYSTSKRARSQSEPMKTGLRIRWILRKAAQYVSGGDDLLPVDLGMKDLVDDAEDAAERRPRSPGRGRAGRQRKQHDPSAGQMGLVERERVDRAGGQGKLVQRKAAKSAADVLLAVAADELGDLRPEAGVNLAVALGIVGQKVDGRELDRLQECPGLSCDRRLRSGAA